MPKILTDRRDGFLLDLIQLLHDLLRVWGIRRSNYIGLFYSMRGVFGSISVFGLAYARIALRHPSSH
jgi:hypothetical protein